MVMCDTGRSGLALLMSVSGTRPQYLAIGSGSGAVAITNTVLIKEPSGLRQVFDTTNIATQKQVKFTTTWDSVTMSGMGLKEFGVFSLASGGKCWNREGFANIAFDGTNELQIEVTFEVF